MKPLLKWVGGKSQILDKILDTFPDTIKNYYEPFLGGGSVLLGVLEHDRIKITENIYVGDINEKLVYFYKNVQATPDEVADELEIILKEFAQCEHREKEVDKNKAKIIRNPTNSTDALYSKESYYYWTRNKYNELCIDGQISPKGSAMLLFLNKTCFRGIYREGPSGFNVPYGYNKNPSVGSKQSIVKLSKLIENVEFVNKSFEELLENVQIGDFVYLDPPYSPEKKESFVEYTNDGFDDCQHEKLFALCKKLNNKHVQFTMSNSSTEFVLDNFRLDMYTVTTISCKRCINSKKPASRTDEVIIQSTKTL